MKSAIALIALTVLSTSALALPPIMMAADLGISQEADDALTGVGTKSLMVGDKFRFPNLFEFKKSSDGKFRAQIGVEVCSAEINTTAPDLNIVQLTNALEWTITATEDRHLNSGSYVLFTLNSTKAPGRIMKVRCDMNQLNLDSAIAKSNIALARSRTIERINYEGESFGKQARIRLDGELPDGSIERRPVWDGITDTRRPGGGRPGTR